MQEKRNEQTTGTKTIKKIGKTTYEVMVGEESLEAALCGTEITDYAKSIPFNFASYMSASKFFK